MTVTETIGGSRPKAPAPLKENLKGRTKRKTPRTERVKEWLLSHLNEWFTAAELEQALGVNHSTVDELMTSFEDPELPFFVAEVKHKRVIHYMAIAKEGLPYGR